MSFVKAYIRPQKKKMDQIQHAPPMMVETIPKPPPTKNPFGTPPGTSDSMTSTVNSGTSTPRPFASKGPFATPPGTSDSMLSPVTSGTSTPRPWVNRGPLATPPGTSDSRRSAMNTGTSTPRSRQSQYPEGDFRNRPQDHINLIKAELALEWIAGKQQEHGWINKGPNQGVVMRVSKGHYISAPHQLKMEPQGLVVSAEELNVRSLMTVTTLHFHPILLCDGLDAIPIGDGLFLQLLPNIPALASCARNTQAAFIKDHAMLVVWGDSPSLVLEKAAEVEKRVISVFSRGMEAFTEIVEENEHEAAAKAAKQHKKAQTTKAPWQFWKNPEIKVNEIDDTIDAEDQMEAPRKLILVQSILCACTLILIILALGTGWRAMAIEIVTDHKWIRLAFILVMPLQIWLALFFMQSVAGCFAQMFGPVAQMTQNSKYYSGKAPAPLQTRNLPHVTIQCPVYKEGLQAVLIPTVNSLKTAMAEYEMRGGTVSIFVNDDGMQIIPEEEAQARRDYYAENQIGWVARPKHKPNPPPGEEAFIRPGKFKKASNMNYAMAVSARIEDKMAKIQRHEKWTKDDENLSYQRCMEQVKVEDQGRTWADGNVRIGDYILIIDCDTRVPKTCFLSAVSELERSPEVAILQFSSGVMNVGSKYFEMGITFFTNLIYTAIRFAVANGDVAPFVGHNAFLRWSALQDIAYEEDGVEKYWSEKTVSEDFDMALRLQTEGYLVRLGGYTKDEFQEGVSLTVYDELSRWEKYAYGCNELLFHPVKYWFTRGIFTPLFKKFIFSNMPLPSKITIMAYIGTYYAIGSAWILTLANYLLTGWYYMYLDHYYVDSFRIYVAIIVVFSIVGNIALAVLRYRINEGTLLGGIWGNFKWILLLTVFLGGISVHVSQALLSHMFSIDMNWGATAKEETDTTFAEEISMVFKKFWKMWLGCIIGAAMLVYLAKFAPGDWKIDFFTAIWPLATIIISHFILPIVLNPKMMLLTW